MELRTATLETIPTVNGRRPLIPCTPMPSRRPDSPIQWQSVATMGDSKSRFIIILARIYSAICGEQDLGPAHLGLLEQLGFRRELF